MTDRLSPMRLTTKQVFEMALIEDTFCTVVAGLEPVGPCHRLVFVRPEPIFCTACDGSLVVVSKVILPVEELAALAEAIPQYLAGHSVQYDLSNVVKLH